MKQNFTNRLFNVFSGNIVHIIRLMPKINYLIIEILVAHSIYMGLLDYSIYSYFGHYNGCSKP